MAGFSMQTMEYFFEQKFIRAGFSAGTSQHLNIIILCAILVVFAIVTKFILHHIIHNFLKKWVDRSDNKIDDIFFEKGTFKNLSHMAPALILLFLAPVPLAPYEHAVAFAKTAAHIYFIAIIISIITAIIDALHEIYNRMPSSAQKPINGYVQVSKVFVLSIGALLILSIIIKKDLSSLVAGLTAFAAVLMFVFKDLILGIIAGIQISANDIVRIGDTIEMPGRNTEGTVIAITLNTVKVLNSNRTISTIPSHALVSESFQNWRGLDIAGGRRIKRTINVDIHSIVFVDEHLIAGLKKNTNITSIAGDSIAKIGSDSQMTNLGAFRLYLEHYLKSLPEINTESFLSVSYLQSTEHGLPLQLFAYSRFSDSTRHEALQNRIFEHIFAIIPVFNLRVFQRPSGSGRDVHGNV